MINTESPNSYPIYIPATWKDYILITFVVLSCVLIWLTGLYYQEKLSETMLSWYLFPAATTIGGILSIYYSYRPIKLKNYPVQITDRNKYAQYLLAKRSRILFTIEVNLAVFVQMMANANLIQDMRHIFISLIIIVISILTWFIYCIIARLYR